jgi:DNA/RNA endonuclease YhcR with UshA esterase domain
MFKRMLGGMALLALVASYAPPRVWAADPPPPVVINELMWMGSSASSADEWIELRNISEAMVDLSGWQITRRSGGTEALMLSIPSGKSIPASGYLLIANNAPTAMFGTAPDQKESPLAAAPDLVDASVSLLNSGLQLKLYAGAWDAGALLVDTADDGSGNPLAGAHDTAKGAFASMERNLVPGDGTQASNWHTATRASGWDTNATEFGTPGSANSAPDPVAILSSPSGGTVGQPLSFDATESSDPEGRELTYAWTFGDGATASGPEASHAFAGAGTFSVVVVVSNNERTATASSSVNVTEPVASPTPDPPPVLGDFGLSELQPSPSGAEFIEVENRGSASAHLTDWVVADSTRRFTVRDTPSVGAGAVHQFPVAVSGIHLNDDGDTVFLYDPSGTLRDAVRYTKSRSGWSLIRGDSVWAWTNHPTPGARNLPSDTTPAGIILDAPEPPAPGAQPAPDTVKKSGPTKSTTKVATAIPELSLDAVPETDKGASVRVRGNVSAVPGTVAARTFYLTDAASGLAVYSAKSPLPALALGDRVEVTGRVSHVTKGDRLLVSRATDVRVLGHGTPPVPRVISASELDADARGSFVNASGTVTDVTSSRITLDDGTGEVSVRRPKGLKVTVGDLVAATGIALGAESGVVLAPRGLDDIRAEKGQVAGAETSNPVVPTAQAATPGQPITIDSPKPDRTGTALLWFGGALLLGAAALGLLKRFAPQLWEHNPRTRRSV